MKSDKIILFALIMLVIILGVLLINSLIVKTPSANSSNANKNNLYVPLGFGLLEDEGSIIKVSFTLTKEGWSMGNVHCLNYLLENYDVQGGYWCVLDVINTNFAELVGIEDWWVKGKTIGECRCEFIA